MSLFAKEVITKKTSESKESIITKLLSLDDYVAKTEIKNVIGMSVYDLVAFHLSSRETKQALMKYVQMKTYEKGANILSGDYMLYLGAWIRINGISHDRGSRNEAVTALGGLPSESEKDKKIIGQFFD